MEAGSEAETKRSSGRGAGVAAVVLAVTAFSWGFILVKLIDLPPPVLAFWRLFLGAATLTAAAVVWRVPFPPLSRSFLWAGLAFGAHQLLFITASKWTSVAIVTLIAAAQPLLVAVVAHRWVGEAVSGRLLAFSALAVGGVALVIDANLAHASRSLAGDLLAVLNLAVFTGYFLAAKRVRLAGAPTLTFTAGFLWMACLVVLPAAVWSGWSLPNRHQGGLLVILALGPGNGHLLVNWAHRRVSATLSSLVLAAVPLLSSVWAHFVLGEPYGWRHAVGMALVAIAIEGGRRAEGGNPAMTATRREGA